MTEIFTLQYKCIKYFIALQARCFDVESVANVFMTLTIATMWKFHVPTLFSTIGE